MATIRESQLEATASYISELETERQSYADELAALQIEFNRLQEAYDSLMVRYKQAMADREMVV